MTKRFTCYSCVVRRKQPGAAGMDRFDEMRVGHATAPEIQTLLRLHGISNVTHIQPNGAVEELDDATLALILRAQYTRPDKGTLDISARDALQEMVLSPIARGEELPAELPATQTGTVKVAKKAKAEAQE